MRPEDLLCPSPQGLYCKLGDFHIDPVQPVARALITHGHSDHARPGHGAVLATAETLKIMAVRYPEGFAGTSQAAKLGDTMRIGAVDVTFHPAGHVLGSAQFPGRAHLIGAYSLGKAQRVIRLLRDAGYDRPVYLHGSMERLCRLYEGEGISLGPLAPATIAKGAKGEFAGAVVICPPQEIAERWARRFPDPVPGFASGWMRIRQRAKQQNVELPLVLSDHADWDELTFTIRELAPREVWVTHGREEALVRWCGLNGIPAKPLHMVGYEDEAE